MEGGPAPKYNPEQMVEFKRILLGVLKRECENIRREIKSRVTPVGTEFDDGRCFTRVDQLIQIKNLEYSVSNLTSELQEAFAAFGIKE